MTDQEPMPPAPRNADPVLKDVPQDRPMGLSKELQMRIASGLVAAAVALLMLYLGPKPFAVLTFIVAAVMSWEWSKIVRGAGIDTVTVVHVVTVLVAALLTGWGMAALGVAALAVGAIAVAALLFGTGQAQLSGLGVLYTGLPVVALGWLREDQLGFLAVLFVVLIVVMTDTAAYFAGRTIGGPKLWPAVSPKKTWAGLIGGVTAAALAGALFPMLTGSGSSLWLGALGLALGLVAQAGDLAESALKRHFGLKDASDLIPGHGGFMDRMDGVVTASILAALLALLIDAYMPARALLYGS
jgi:phosphatidate cytidylyltransferase